MFFSGVLVYTVPMFKVESEKLWRHSNLAAFFSSENHNCNDVWQEVFSNQVSYSCESAPVLFPKPNNIVKQT